MEVPAQNLGFSFNTDDKLCLNCKAPEATHQLTRFSRNEPMPILHDVSAPINTDSSQSTATSEETQRFSE
jgi:hypothetical protein